MIFFPAGQHARVKDGTITVTFRAWDRPRAKAGSLQRSHPLGVIAIEEVTAVELRAVTDEEARRAGLRDRKELVAFVRAKLAEATPSTIVYRIAFRFAGDADFAPSALDTELTQADLAAITLALREADRASARPWTRATLELVAAHPRTVASALAEQAGRDRASFKADVVKLKKLGLTQSFGVGYDLTPRGRAYLAAAAAATASEAQSARRSRSTRARKAGSKTPSTRME